MRGFVMICVVHLNQKAQISNVFHLFDLLFSYEIVQ